jgi:acetolactate synthase I/II/III large subunit
VDTVFGIPGVHTIELYRGLQGSSISHITPRHEQGAAFMADGYSIVSRRPGVCILITGAGLTNAATGIASAYHDSHPLLIISSATETSHAAKGRGTLHDLPDQQQFMDSITAFSETVLTPEDLPAAMDRAFAVLEGPRPRPVHVGIPIDILSLPAAEPKVSPRPRREARPSPTLDDTALRRAAELLTKARDPIIILGGGGLDAGDAALRISRATGAPIATTINGRGAVPDTHPASVGATLTLDPVFGALGTADVVLAVGTEFSEVDYYFQTHIPRFAGVLIRVDIDPKQVATGPAASVALVGDAEETLTQLAELLMQRELRGATAATRAADLRAKLEWWEGAEVFFPILDAIAAPLQNDAIVTADSTQLAYVANGYFPVELPRSYLSPAGFGTLGPALPMAIGAKIAARDRPVVCLIGDGGLLFTVSELATAAQLHLPIAIVVWQNHGYQEMRDSMDRAGVNPIGTDATAPNYLALARGLGCHAVKVTSVDQISETISAALGADRPTLIEVPAVLAK